MKGEMRMSDQNEKESLQLLGMFFAGCKEKNIPTDFIRVCEELSKHDDKVFTLKLWLSLLDILPANSN